VANFYDINLGFCSRAIRTFSYDDGSTEERGNVLCEFYVDPSSGDLVKDILSRLDCNLPDRVEDGSFFRGYNAKTRYVTLPKYMMVRMKRHTDGEQRYRIPDEYEFEEKLDFNALMHKPTTESLQYSLHGVVAYCGSGTYGHYIVFIKGPDGRWRVCNDSHVGPAGPDWLKEISGAKGGGFISMYALYKSD
jgi:hypothetical protein